MGRHFGNFTHRVGQQMLDSYEYGDEEQGYGPYGPYGSAYGGAELADYVDTMLKGSCDDALWGTGWMCKLAAGTDYLFSGPCEHLQSTILQRNDHITAAQIINSLLLILQKYVEKVCQRRCELSWWISMRAFGNDNDLSQEAAGITHNCQEEAMCQTGSDDYKGSAQRTYTEQKAQAFLNKGVSPTFYTSDELMDWDSCDFRRLVQNIADTYGQLIAEYNRIGDDIAYEMSQRGNLTQLRGEKGIEDWHLKFIYPDREERLNMTNPQSDIGQNYQAEQASRPYIWLGVATAVSVGMIAVLGKWKSTRAES